MTIQIAKHLLEKIYKQNEDLLQQMEYNDKEYDYNELYKSFQICNLRIENVIDLLDIAIPKKNN